jgi:hypothetical protein
MEELSFIESDLGQVCNVMRNAGTGLTGSDIGRYLRKTGLRDPKLLDAAKVDTKKNKVQVDLSRLYKGIDLPETLSNLTGKRIRRTSVQSRPSSDEKTAK